MSSTSDYYKTLAREFYDSTVEADVTPLYERVLAYVPAGGAILDLGCGSGRDTSAFLKMGYKVEAIDGSAELCALASSYCGIEVKCMDFRDVDGGERFDAIWACASLLHVPTAELPELLTTLRDLLAPGGIFYMSFKFGDFEGERDGRFFNDMTSDKFASVFARTSGYEKIDEWESRDVRRGKDVDWYNVILRKL